MTLKLRYGQMEMSTIEERNKVLQILNYLEIYPNVDLNDIPKIIINNYDKSTEGKHLIIGID